MNPVIAGAKLGFKRSTLQNIEKQLHALLAERATLEKAVDEAQTEEDLNAVEAQIEEKQQAVDQLEQEKTTLEADIAELEEVVQRSNDKKPKGVERSVNSNESEVREGINAYVKSKGQVRDMEGFKSVNGEAIIPEELLALQKAPEDIVDLSKYVKNVSVSTASGSYPIIKKSGSRMATVEELQQNPELAKPTISEIDFKVATYRGYIPIAQEVIDDAYADVVGIIAEEIRDQELNTKNKRIADVLKSAPTATIANVDALLTLINKNIKKYYAVTLYVSASLFNALDQLKDNNGRYLMQDDITSPTGKSFKGKHMVVLDDNVIGAKDGDMVGFVGDAKQFCTFFNRKQASVKWIDNDIYGQLLAGYIRFDVQKTDENAGFYITYTGTPGSEVTTGAGKALEGPTTTTTETPTPTPQAASLRLVKTGDVTTRSDNTLDGATIDAQGNVTNKRAFNYKAGEAKTVLFMPAGVTEMEFTSTNKHHNILVGSDDAQENGVGISFRDALKQYYNLALGTTGTLGEVKNVTKVTNEHTPAVGTKYKVVSDADKVTISFYDTNAYKEWFTLDKKTITDVQWYKPRLGAIGGISPSNETSTKILGEAKIKTAN